jgi:hypothetical protein
MTKPAASRLGRAWAALDTARGWRIALVAGPLFFALLSLSYGQDSNWDLQNYHLYNPFALLHGKVGFDLAPGVWQSYFNPTLDLLYYGLATTLRARLAGAIMGALHGLNFVLIAYIALHLLPRRFASAAPAPLPRAAAHASAASSAAAPAAHASTASPSAAATAFASATSLLAVAGASASHVPSQRIVAEGPRPVPTRAAAGAQEAAQADAHAARPPYRLALLLAAAGSLGPAFLSEVGNTMGDNMTALCVLGSLLLIVRATLQPGGALRANAAAASPLLLAGLVMGIGTGLKLTNATYALALCLALFALGRSLFAFVRAGWLFGLGVLAGIALSAGHWYWRMWATFGNPLFPQFNDRFQSPMAAPIGIGDTGWLPKTALESWLWPFLFTLDPKRICEIPLRHLLWPLLYVALIVAAGAALLTLARRRPVPQALQIAPGARLVLAFGVLSYLLWLKLFSIYRYLVPMELIGPLMFFLLLQGWNARLAGRVLAFTALAGVLLFKAGHGNWGHGHWTKKAFDVEVPMLAAPERSVLVMVQAPTGWLASFFPDSMAVVSLGAGFPESDGYRNRVQAILQERNAGWYVLLKAEQDAQPRAQETLARYALQADLSSCRQYRAMIGTDQAPYQLCTLHRSQ